MTPRRPTLLTVAGAFDTGTTEHLVLRHFGAVPARATDRPPLLHEPGPTTEPHGRHDDPLAPCPPPPSATACPTPPPTFPATSPSCCSRPCSKSG
ncbi:hypothetical protein [Streptomyces sp. NPDC102462]|uniref:hypothetical protein n=1 Tax=Streptomyces sp. NPDC102462 TaxID=3366178 RepID=UPI0038141447